MKKLSILLALVMVFAGMGIGAAASVFYTVNAPMPTEKSTPYTAPITLNKTMQIKYMIKDNTTKYGIINHEITKKKNQTVFPLISFNGTVASLIFPENLIVYYTVNGKQPTNKSAIYTSPIILDKNMIVKYLIVSNNTTYTGIVKHTPCKFGKGCNLRM